MLKTIGDQCVQVGRKDAITKNIFKELSTFTYNYVRAGISNGNKPQAKAKGQKQPRKIKEHVAR
jgi:hypothetical protein